jgi:hypothetical protein
LTGTCQPGSADTACGATGTNCLDCTAGGQTCSGTMCTGGVGSSSGSASSSAGGGGCPGACKPCTLGMVACRLNACQCCVGTLCLPD